MVNTKILTSEFEYHQAESLGELFKLMNQYGTRAKIIAGGTDIIPGLKYERMATECLISIANVKDLNYIEEDQSLIIGAATKLSEIKKYCSGKKNHALLHDAIASIAKIQILNMGTLGGNLCTASPAADSAPALLTLNAKVKLSDGKNERVVALKDFFVNVQKSFLKTNEIMTEIEIPPTNNDTSGAFQRMLRVAADISKLSCAVLIQRQGDVCQSAAIALGSVAPTPIRLFDTEPLLENQRVTQELINSVGQAVSDSIQPITDIRSTESYRKQVAGVLFKDVFQIAWQRAGISNGK